MKRSRHFLAGIMLAAGCFPAGLLHGEEGALPSDILRQIGETSRHGGDWLWPVLEEWNDARKRLEKRVGLSWSARYDTVTLVSMLGDGVSLGSSGDFTLQGIWAPAQRWEKNPTELRFRVRDRHAHGGTAASELGPDMGALWGVVDGFSDSGFEVPDFFIRHEFERLGLEFRYGQLSIDSQFGGHQLASAKRYFVNQAFASNPAVAFPRFGAGLTLLKKFNNGLSVGLGATTVQATQTGDQVDLTFGSSDIFTALQVAYDFKGDDGLSKRVQVLGWHSDAVKEVGRPDGGGVTITYEQQLDDEGAHLFGRLSWAQGGAAPLDQLLVAGMGRSCRRDDALGLAAGIGRGSNPDHDIQAVVEAFYRWHPRKNLLISPDVQLLVGEGFRGGPGIRLVTGVRASLTF